MRSKVRGFSLVELMIVVVIVGLMGALAAPTLSSSMERNRLSQLNRDVGNAFIQSRSHAMRSGQAVFVKFENNRIRFYEPGFDPDDDDEWDAPTCTLAQDNGPNDANTLFDINPEARGVERVEIQEPDPDIAKVCISPNGRILQTSGQPLESGGDSDCQEMNLLIPIYDPDGAGDFDYCDDSDVAVRELNRFSMIHVAYGGQVRVIR